jgi:hypothetical protein
MTTERRAAMLAFIEETTRVVRVRARMRCKRLGGLIGSLDFLRAQVPRASLYLRGCHSALTKVIASVGWTGSATIPWTVISEIRFWHRSVSYNTPGCFIPRLSQATLTTDAAESGWGAELRIGDRQLLTFGFFLTDALQPTSNQRETIAVLRSLRYFRPVLQTERVSAMTVRSDNAPTASNLQRQGAGLSLLQLM